MLQLFYVSLPGHKCLCFFEISRVANKRQLQKTAGAVSSEPERSYRVADVSSLCWNSIIGNARAEKEVWENGESDTCREFRRYPDQNLSAQ